MNGDEVLLRLPMPVRKVIAHDSIEDNSGRFAVQRGPLVYCMEWVDQDDQRVFNLMGKPDTQFLTRFENELLDGVTRIQFDGFRFERDDTGSLSHEEVTISAIPYYAWANRDPGEMLVWLPFEEEAVRENILLYLTEKE